jgi:hypothetical protein
MNRVARNRRVRQTSIGWVWVYDIAWMRVLGGIRLLTERFAAHRTAKQVTSGHDQPPRLQAASRSQHPTAPDHRSSQKWLRLSFKFHYGSASIARARSPVSTFLLFAIVQVSSGIAVTIAFRLLIQMVPVEIMRSADSDLLAHC